MTEGAREAVLARIRKGIDLPAAGRAGSVPPALAILSPSSPGEGVTIPSDFRTNGSRSRTEVLGLFAERVSDYRASVVRVSSAELPRALVDALERRSASRLAVPEDLPVEWLGKSPAGFLEVLKDEPGGGRLSKEQLASCHGVLTGCALGIAETGTLVLDAGRAQGRRALTLLPDYHLCVVFGRQVVETVPEAVTAMEGAAASRRPITLISGPSATSDIELIRVEGVHGPRNLEVILVEEAP